MFTCRSITNQPALLFLHGFLGCKEDWSEVISHLEEDFLCVALDLPGHGDSPYHLDLFQEINAILDKYQLSQATLIGYSLGGRLSLLYNERFPERVRKLILLGAHPGLSHPSERLSRLREDQNWAELLETVPLEQFLNLWYEQPLFAAFRERKEIFQQAMHRRASQKSSSLAYILRTYSLGLQPQITQFSEKMLFVHGEKDLKYGELYRKLSSQVGVQSIPQCGHAIHLEAPEACAKVISQTMLPN